MREVLTPYGAHGQWDLQFFHGKVAKLSPATVLVRIPGKQQFYMSLWKHFKYIDILAFKMKEVVLQHIVPAFKHPMGSDKMPDLWLMKANKNLSFLDIVPSYTIMDWKKKL